MNWHELASTSPYRTAVAVEQSLRQGNTAEAAAGLQELIESLARSDKRALKSHLIRLMTHVLKWHTQPERRSRSWRATIRNARREIADIQEDTPSLNRAAIEALWASCLETAREDAAADMDQEPSLTSLSWDDAFEADYEL